MLPNSRLEEGSVRVFLVVFAIPFEPDFLELKKVYSSVLTSSRTTQIGPPVHSESISSSFP